MGAVLDVTARRQAEQVQREYDRMQRELDIAHRVQQSLLPDEPLTIPGYNLAGWSEPATEAGGDYFDWLMLPDGRAVVVIADATEHGMGPALMVTAPRAYFRAAAPLDEGIENVVARVNDLIADDVQQGTFVTAAIATLDPSEHLLSVYSAGHGPILFYRASEGTALAWAADNFPLGIFTPMSVSPARRLPSNRAMCSCSPATGSSSGKIGTGNRTVSNGCGGSWSGITGCRRSRSSDSCTRMSSSLLAGPCRWMTLRP